MKNSPAFLAGIAVVGLLAGLLFGGISTDDQSSQSNPEAGANTSELRSRSNRDLNSSSQVTRPQSGDTLETIKTAPPEELYSRLALWLMTASPDEIEDYWNHFLSQDERPREIYDLVMIGWTRVDPEGAIAAVDGTPNEKFSWWAWTCHNPEAALERVMRTHPDKAGYVTWGLGEFHPKWVRENFEKIPENERGNALAGMTKWNPTDDPMATAEFLATNGRIPPAGMLRYLVRQDPQAAFDWFESNSEELGSRYGGGGYEYQSIAEALAKDAPEFLDEIIKKTQEEGKRFQFELAAFDQRLKHDLEGALAKARENPNPSISSHLLSKAGIKIASTDPDRAFEIARSLVDSNENPFQQLMITTGEDSVMSFGRESQNFLAILARKDPQRTMEEVISNINPQQADQTVGLVQSALTVGLVSKVWANQDPDGMATWLAQSESEHSELMTSQLTNYFVRSQRFQEAIDLVRDRENSVRNIHHRWQQNNPAEAQEWLEKNPEFIPEVENTPEGTELVTPPLIIE